MSDCFLNKTFDRGKGLTYQHTDVMCFNLKGRYYYLALPREMKCATRRKGLYTPEKKAR